MSLIVYTDTSFLSSDVKVIDNNDVFFNGLTALKNTELEKEILFTIDKAHYNSSQTFIGRSKELGALNKEHLSTGTKTLLNILSYSNICFSVNECGNNALCFLPKIRNGIVSWEFRMVLYDGDSECDILLNNKEHFNNFYDFLNYVYYRR